jgi:hypothetical protein
VFNGFSGVQFPDCMDDLSQNPNAGDIYPGSTQPAETLCDMNCDGVVD